MKWGSNKVGGKIHPLFRVFVMPLIPEVRRINLSQAASRDRAVQNRKEIIEYYYFMLIC